MDTQDNLKGRLAEFLERVWNMGNVNASDDLVAAAYTIHHDPGDPWDGMTLTREKFKDRVRKSRLPFPDQRFTTVRMIQDGGSIAVSWRWTGTQKGDLPGFPASGRQVTMTGITIYDFDAHGCLTGHWQLVDRLGVYQQLNSVST